MSNQTPTQLRQRAAEKDAEARESFERCDTDGFLSQWASGLEAQRLRMQADLEENDGKAQFLALFDLDGNWVPARWFNSQYGTRWMLLDEHGEKTGQYLTYAPARRNTLAKHGFVEGYVLRPAAARFIDDRYGNVRAAVVPTDNPWQQPIAIISTDRWAD